MPAGGRYVANTFLMGWDKILIFRGRKPLPPSWSVVIRQGLAKNSKIVDVLKAMAKRAMAAGDWHYPRFV